MVVHMISEGCICRKGTLWFKNQFNIQTDHPVIFWSFRVGSAKQKLAGSIPALRTLRDVPWRQSNYSVVFRLSSANNFIATSKLKDRFDSGSPEWVSSVMVAQ